MKEINNRPPTLDEILPAQDLEYVMSMQANQEEGEQPESQPLTNERATKILHGLEDLRQDDDYGLEKSLIIANSLTRSRNIPLRNLAITQKRNLVYQESCRKVFKNAPGLKEWADNKIDVFSGWQSHELTRRPLGRLRRLLDDENSLWEEIRPLWRSSSRPSSPDIKKLVTCDPQMVSLATTRLANKSGKRIKSGARFSDLVNNEVCQELKRAVEHYILSPFINGTDQLAQIWGKDNLNYQPISFTEQPNAWQESWQSGAEYQYWDLWNEIKGHEVKRQSTKGLEDQELEYRKSLVEGVLNNNEIDPNLRERYENVIMLMHYTPLRHNEDSIESDIEFAKEFIDSIDGYLDREAAFNPELYKRSALALQRYLGRESFRGFSTDQKELFAPKINVDRAIHYISRRNLEESLFPDLLDLRANFFYHNGVNRAAAVELSQAGLPTTLPNVVEQSSNPTTWDSIKEAADRLKKQGLTLNTDNLAKRTKHTKETISEELIIHERTDKIEGFDYTEIRPEPLRSTESDLGLDSPLTS